MTVREFVSLDKLGCLYTVVSTKQAGYMRSDAKVEIIADKNVVSKMYGDKEVNGFEPITKKNIKLYIG